MAVYLGCCACLGCAYEYIFDEKHHKYIPDHLYFQDARYYAPRRIVKLLLDVDDLELADLLLALEGYGLQIAADDVPRVAALRNQVRVATGMEPEPVWGEE